MYSQLCPWEKICFLSLLWSGHSSCSLLYSEFLPSSLHAVFALTFSLSGSLLSHSSLAILCNGTNSLFSRASSIQCEVARAKCMGSFHACSLCTELYTKRQQITTNKTNYARHLTSFKEQNSLLYNRCCQNIYTHWNIGQVFKCLLALLLRKTMTSSDKTENHNSVFPMQD